MKFRWLTLFFMFVAAAIATTKFAREMAKVRTPGKVATVSCAALPATCHMAIGGHPLELSFSPAPVLLKPFTLNVKAPAARSVFAEFAMVGMDMGIAMSQTLDGYFTLDPVKRKGGFLAHTVSLVHRKQSSVNVLTKPAKSVKMAG